MRCVVSPAPQQAAEGHFQCWAARLSAPRGAPWPAAPPVSAAQQGLLLNVCWIELGADIGAGCRSEDITQHPVLEKHDSRGETSNQPKK